MSTVSNQPGAKKDEDKENQPAGGQTIGGAAPVGNSGSPGSGGIGAQASQKTPTSSGAFTDVGKYLEANSANAGKFAKDTASGFQGKVQQVGDDAEAKQQEIVGGINSQRVDPTDYQGKKATEITPGFGGGVVLPTDNTMVDSRNEAAKMQGRAETLNTMGGRGSYLREELTPSIKDYSVGENRLDTLMTMGNQEANQVYKEAGEGANALTGTLDNLEAGIGTAVADTKAFNDQEMKNYRNYVSGLRGGIESNRDGLTDGRNDALSGGADSILNSIFRNNTVDQNPFGSTGTAGLGQTTIHTPGSGTIGANNPKYSGPSGSDAWTKYMSETGGPGSGYTAEQAGELSAIDALLGNDKQTYNQYNEADEKAKFEAWMRENYGDVGVAGNTKYDEPKEFTPITANDSFSSSFQQY